MFIFQTSKGEVTYPAGLMETKVKVELSKLGMSEKYISINYLCDLIVYFFRYNNDSKECYNNALEMLQQKYHLTQRSIIGGLQQILKFCHKKFFENQCQLKINTYSSLNKIRVIKKHIMKLIEDEQ